MLTSNVNTSASVRQLICNYRLYPSDSVSSVFPESAARLARMAVDVLEEGNRLWPDNQVSYDDKGHSFKSTLVRLAKTYLMGKLSSLSDDSTRSRCTHA
jgi:hypothetical protein